MVVTSGIALASSPSWPWCFAVIVLASACSQSHCCMLHSCCAGVVVVRGLVTLHAACNLVITCGIIVTLALFLCATLLPYTVLLLLSAAVDADLPCPLPPLPSAIITKHGIFAILVSLMPVTILSLAFALPDAIVMAHFVGNSRVVIHDIIVCSCCMQHCCDARLCNKLPKMPSSTISLGSSFSCVLVHTLASVNGRKKGNGDSN